MFRRESHAPVPEIAMPRAIAATPPLPAGSPVAPRLREHGNILVDQTVVAHYLGELLRVFGWLLLLPLVFWTLDGEVRQGWGGAEAYLVPGLLSLLLGEMGHRVRSDADPTVRDAMVITGLAWLVTSWLAAVPFQILLHKPFIDAWFESVSGLTTTGITVFEGLDAMPRSILLWRSQIQWVGGLGILTFFLAVALRNGSTAANLFSSEGHKIGGARPVPSIHQTVRILWGIYLLWTVVPGLAFWLLGMSPFDALCHSLTAISTGGFSTHDASVGWFAAQGLRRAGWLELAVIVTMLAGGMNFLVHFKILTGERRALWRDFEMRWYWGLVLAFTGLIVLDHWLHAPGARHTLAALPHAGRTALFQVASMISSTGYATRDIGAAWFPALSKQLFLLLMIIGGCVGSTAGGIKVLRLGILLQMLRNQVHRLTAPRRAALPVVVAGKPVPTPELVRVGALLAGWLVLIAVGAGVTAMFSHLDAWQSFSGMASAVGNMGPFYFSVHAMAGLGGIIKFTYIIGMLAGRLEILPLIVLLSRTTWR